MMSKPLMMTWMPTCQMSTISPNVALVSEGSLWRGIDTCCVDAIHRGIKLYNILNNLHPDLALSKSNYTLGYFIANCTTWHAIVIISSPYHGYTPPSLKQTLNVSKT